MFCRIGDFYELFYDDAILVARELQLTLTARDREKKQPMCGVPYHAAEVYLQRLLRKGYRVVLWEQVEDPKKTKTRNRNTAMAILHSLMMENWAGLPSECRSGMTMSGNLKFGTRLRHRNRAEIYIKLHSSVVRYTE